MEKFAIGLLFGATVGALLTVNSCKMRALVKKGQAEVKEKFDEVIDEKLKETERVFPTKKGKRSEKKNRSTTDEQE